MCDCSVLKRHRQKEWKDHEYFDITWRKRIELMSKYIPKDSSVMDLGCGKMWLKESVMMEKYIPVDYCDRGEGTLIFDFNKKEFPEEIDVDVAFVSGCLEYVEDPRWFISKIRTSASSCIISYCSTDEVPSLEVRRELSWANHLSREDLITYFREVDMKLVKESFYSPSNNIFYFSK